VIIVTVVLSCIFSQIVWLIDWKLFIVCVSFLFSAVVCGESFRVFEWLQILRFTMPPILCNPHMELITVAVLLRCYSYSPVLLDLMRSMLSVDPASRPNISQAIDRLHLLLSSSSVSFTTTAPADSREVCWLHLSQISVCIAGVCTIFWPVHHITWSIVRAGRTNAKRVIINEERIECISYYVFCRAVKALIFWTH